MDDIELKALTEKAKSEKTADASSDDEHGETAKLVARIQAEMAKEPSALDVYTYAGAISLQGYEALCKKLAGKKADRALLVLATPGGDPHAGFRIARALQHAYGDFEALVPRYCKSAGTLILTGASKIYMADRSELGPLDVQVLKGDELFARNSGLDFVGAVEYLKEQAISTFRDYVLELTAVGLSTRVGSEIASKLTTGLFEPIAAQIEPIRLAEMQRATEIAYEYGSRLNAKSDILLRDGIEKLVTGYPSHGFVIDRKEARSIFKRVQSPENIVALFAETFKPSAHEVNANAAEVTLFNLPLPVQPQEPPHEDVPDPKAAEGGNAQGERPLDEGRADADKADADGAGGGAAHPEPTPGA